MYMYNKFEIKMIPSISTFKF